MTHSDILIIGSGLAGAATALALADLGLSIHVIDHEPIEKALNTDHDGRASAISEASVRLLKSLGAWDGMAADAEPIRDILVVDGFSSALVHFDHHKAKLSKNQKADNQTPFGYIIPNPSIRTALLRKAQAHANITLHHSARVAQYHRSDSSAGVTLDDGRVLTANLMVACDGRFSKTREWMGITHRTTMYGQTALVCTIEHDKPHQGVALERFLDRGPFAVLPMTGNRSCVVWTEPDAMYKHFMRLSDTELNECLMERAGNYLGAIRVVGTRHSYPLSLVQSDGYVAQRTVLVGDAAHGIHPIAGQGINLGYRDVAALRDVLRDALRTGADIGGELTLERYNRWRAFDAVSMGMVMDGLVRLFSNDFTPIRLARRLGLRIVDKLFPAKQFFMLHAMGLLGDLPEMLRAKDNSHAA